MYEYIEGPLIEKNPAYCVIEVSGIGYFIQLSLTTFSQLEAHTRAKLFVHQVVREDAHLLFGFYQKQEREMFRLLLSVSGVGANTARSFPLVSAWDTTYTSAFSGRKRRPGRWVR